MASKLYAKLIFEVTEEAEARFIKLMKEKGFTTKIAAFYDMLSTWANSKGGR